MIKPILAFLLALSAATAGAQSFQSGEFDSDSLDHYMMQIDDRCQQMDDSLIYWIKESHTFGCQYNYGEVSMFMANGRLRMLKLELFGEYAAVTTTYYFDHGRLFYVLDVTLNWDPGFSGETGEDKTRYHLVEQYIYLYQEYAFDCRKRELEYQDDFTRQYFNDITPVAMDCELNYFPQQAGELLRCCPFKEFEPCLCGD